MHQPVDHLSEQVTEKTAATWCPRQFGERATEYNARVRSWAREYGCWAPYMKVPTAVSDPERAFLGLPTSKDRVRANAEQNLVVATPRERSAAQIAAGAAWGARMAGYRKQRPTTAQKRVARAWRKRQK